MKNLISFCSNGSVGKNEKMSYPVKNNNKKNEMSSEKEFLKFD